MTDLFWPGDERAGGLLSQSAFLEAMVSVEQAWLDTLVEAGLAPDPVPLAGLVDGDSVETLARGAEGGGNPVLGLVKLLRDASTPWVHRGLTSQDVVDSALVLCLRDTTEAVRSDLRRQVAALSSLAEAHRDTLMAARTLTQHAVPTTFGLKAATWLGGVLDAAETVSDLRFPAQLGGAAGTLSAVTELLESVGPDPAQGRADSAREPAAGLAAAAAERLGLTPMQPWHTSRAAYTSIGDALVTVTSACGRIATDVVTLSRPEIGEVREPEAAGRGGSSTMPHKQNPILSALVRRAALTTPQLAATLHLAAALAEDERPAGAWHAEWATLRDLGRRTVVACSQTAELLEGLRVDADRMAATAHSAWDALTAERDSVARFTERPPSEGEYLGATSHFIDTTLARASAYLEEA